MFSRQKAYNVHDPASILLLHTVNRIAGWCRQQPMWWCSNLFDMVFESVEGIVVRHGTQTCRSLRILQCTRDVISGPVQRFAYRSICWAVGGIGGSLNDRISSSFIRYMRRAIYKRLVMYDRTGGIIKANTLNPFRSKKLLFFFRETVFFDKNFIQGITLQTRSTLVLSDTVMVPNTICNAHSEMESINVSSKFLTIAFASFGLLDARVESTSKCETILLRFISGENILGVPLRFLQRWQFSDETGRLYFVANQLRYIQNDGRIMRLMQPESMAISEKISGVLAIAVTFGPMDS